jgi:hypothetical protein
MQIGAKYRLRIQTSKSKSEGRIAKQIKIFIADLLNYNAFLFAF